MKLKLETKNGIVYEVSGVQKYIGLIAMGLFRAIFLPLICILIPFVAIRDCLWMNKAHIISGGSGDIFSIRKQMMGYYRETWLWLIHG